MSELLKEAYRSAFATQLAVLGVTPLQLSRELDKRADAGDVAGGAGKLADTLKTVLLGLAAGTGGVIGYGMGASNRVGTPDIDAVKNLALIQDYEEAVKRLRQRNQVVEGLKTAAAVTTPPANPFATKDRIEKAKAKVSGAPLQATPTVPNQNVKAVSQMPQAG